MENQAIWGLSARGAKWALWTYVVLSIAVMAIFTPMAYNNIEPLIHWGIRGKVELFISTLPIIMSGAIMLITGFFSGKDEWRMSITGLGVGMVIFTAGMLISVVIFTNFHASIDWVRAYFLVSTPLAIGLMPFFHSGFIAARDDKRKNRK
jgi:hypothetical protein